MHPNQRKLLDLTRKTDISKMTLRSIGELLGIKNAQTVKFHLRKLIDKGLLTNDYKPALEQNNLISLPIYGTADCGPATFIAEDCIQGFLKISPNIIERKESLYALKASGNSMNKARIREKHPILEGDYVIVDRNAETKNGDYVVAITEGLVNIKRMCIDHARNLVLLKSESTEEYPPIVIHTEDFDAGLVQIAGKVIEVIPSKFY